ncbi:serine protease [Roseomonas sp. 18066]|uniref:trypsin-like serine peptidase n=1 Tax=Roseomonas sp. 18066 TaxID=2681412 RepID=UPI00135CB30E|nr:trypsin-like peptidase domain-containing protein [Roseomonas sp. 18066]
MASSNPGRYAPLAKACLVVLTAAVLSGTDVPARAQSGVQPPPDGAANAAPLLRQRAGQAASAVVEAMQRGPLLGRFIERAAGSYVFVPEDRSLSLLTVTNPDRVSSLAVGPQLLARGRADVAARTLVVEDYALAASAPAPATASARAAAVGAEAVAHAAADAILGRLNAAAQPGGSMNVTSRTLSNDTDLGRLTLRDMRSLAAAHTEAVRSGDRTAEGRIALRWAEVRRSVVESLPDGTEYKAMFGFLDNYPPWRYDWIYRDSAAVVAIGKPDADTALCSGVLIARDLVLTAGHCFSGPPAHAPGQLEVWFQHMRQPDGSSPPRVRRAIAQEPVAPAPERWADLLAGRFGASLFDYAIVRILAPEGEPLLPEGVRPHCLRMRPPDRADPLYVVGYPRGGPVTVHDNARVHLPSRVMDGDEFSLLRMDVAADFPDAAERAEVLREFEESYLLEAQPLELSRFREFSDVRDGGQPRMGIVADTFRGNSGGPVYDRERGQCVVGILNRGMPDTGVRLSATWKVHERVLPVHAILRDLRNSPHTATLVATGRNCRAEDLRRIPIAEAMRERFADGRLCIVD